MRDTVYPYAKLADLSVLKKPVVLYRADGLKD
jgi:hypothetical protein